MPEYSIEEYADMHFVYGEYSGNANAAVRRCANACMYSIFIAKILIEQVARPDKINRILLIHPGFPTIALVAIFNFCRFNHSRGIFWDTIVKMSIILQRAVVVLQ
jgi:hypothetical protein